MLPSMLPFLHVPWKMSTSSKFNNLMFKHRLWKLPSCVQKCLWQRKSKNEWHVVFFESDFLLKTLNFKNAKNNGVACLSLAKHLCNRSFILIHSDGLNRRTACLNSAVPGAYNKCVIPQAKPNLFPLSYCLSVALWPKYELHPTNEPYQKPCTKQRWPTVTPQNPIGRSTPNMFEPLCPTHWHHNTILKKRTMRTPQLDRRGTKARGGHEH